MKNYKMKRLTSKDVDILKFIAQIHESLPSAWIKDYTVSDDTVNKTTEELIYKHKKEQVFCSVIECNDAVISYIWAEVNKNNSKQIDIMSLWTDEKYRGLGHANKLKFALENWAKDEMSAEKIHTTVSNSNENMIQLNEKLGYKTEYYRMVKYL